MVDLVSSYMILGALVQKLIFQGTLAKKTGIFERDMGANFFIKGP